MRWICPLLTMLMLVPLSRAQDLIWFEGEDAHQTNFPKSTWFDPQNADERAVLSGGRWLTNAERRARAEDEAFAKWRVEVPVAGEYHFWTRKLWKHGPFRWRFGTQPWQTVGRDVALADSVTMRTHIPANWVYLGKVNLRAGVQELEIRLLAAEGEEKTAAFDCFVLTRGIFIPNGKLKPGQRSGAAETGFFAWEPAPDPFDQSPIDLRHLNEPIAGQSGRLRRSDDGNQLLLGDGTPVRLWGVNVNAEIAAQDRSAIDYMARRLAKFGVNAVRYHSPLWSDSDYRRIDPKKLDDLHYLVHALKQQGIYTSISFYFPLWMDAKKAGLDGYADGQHPFGAIFFDGALQNMHRGWLRQILSPVNPYTQLPLARDPAVAMVELVNEDSLLFWTMTKRNIPPPQWRKLEQKAGGAVLEAWHMTREGIGNDAGKAAQMRKQVQTLATMQRDFYIASRRSLIDDLGYTGLVVASNWTTADPTILDAAERWSYTGADISDRHGYFGGKHEGEASSYSVRVGQTYEDRSAMSNPGNSPLVTVQTAGQPQIISEVNWPQPNRHRGEMTWLAAVLASGQDIDGLFFFALDNAFLRADTMNKFQLASPAIIGTFPAAALVYRRGDIAVPPPIFVRPLPDDAPFRLFPEDLTDPQMLDELRARDLPAGESGKPASQSVRGSGALLRQFDPQARVGRERDATQSWTFDTAQSFGQFVTNQSIGFAGAIGGERSAGGVTLRTRNERLHVFVVSLDDAPVTSSSRLLVQSMTTDRPYRFATRAGAITSLGVGPFMVELVLGSIEVPSDKPIRATILDENGYPRGEPESFEPKDGRVNIPLPTNAAYLLLDR